MHQYDHQLFRKIFTDRGTRSWTPVAALCLTVLSLTLLFRPGAPGRVNAFETT